MKNLLIGTVIALTFLPNLQLLAQDETPPIITIARAHWNMEYEDFSMDKWKKLEADFHQNVTMKNEFIVGSEVLLHSYTPDNSEILFVQIYSNWENIEKANDRNNELIKEAWANEEERDALAKERNEYYSAMHSDEMYSGLKFAKQREGKQTEPLLVYMRTSHRAWPEDGKVEEIVALKKEFIENVFHKNDDVLGYYPMRHLYGADSREIVEVFVMKSMTELERMNKSRTEELINAHWPDEAKRKEFFKAINRYSTGWHGDLMYTTVPELSK